MKDKPGFPTTFRELIRPLFMDLSNDELHSVHWGINHLPLKNTTPALLPHPPPPPKPPPPLPSPPPPPLNLKTFQASLFKQSPPYVQ